MPDESKAMNRMLDGRRVAVVGLSDDASRPSHRVAAYLLDNGYEIVPVNPNHESVLGIRCRRSLSEVEGPVDVVNVFRRAEHCADVVREAIAAGAKGVWLQSGITSHEAAALAAQAGIDYVEDRCMMAEHGRRAG